MQNLGAKKNQHNFYLFLTYYDSLLWVLRVKKKKKKANAFSVIFNIQVPILFDECSTALSVFSYKRYAAVKSTHVFCADVLFLDLDLDLGVIHKCKSLLCTLKMYVLWQTLSKIRCDTHFPAMDSSACTFETQTFHWIFLMQCWGGVITTLKFHTCFFV